MNGNKNSQQHENRRTELPFFFWEKRWLWELSFLGGEESGVRLSQQPYERVGRYSTTLKHGSVAFSNSITLSNQRKCYFKIQKWSWIVFTLLKICWTRWMTFIHANVKTFEATFSVQAYIKSSFSLVNSFFPNNWN